MTACSDDRVARVGDRQVVPLVTTATATMIAAGRHITASRIIGSTLDLAERPSP